MLPNETLRLFDGVEPADLENPSYRPFVLGRLLEDGDSRDLRWLFSSCDEEELRSWLEDRAQRRLSDRSRGFWLWLAGKGLAEQGLAGKGLTEEPSAGESSSGEDGRFRDSVWPL